MPDNSVHCTALSPSLVQQAMHSMLKASHMLPCTESEDLHRSDGDDDDVDGYGFAIRCSQVYNRSQPEQRRASQGMLHDSPAEVRSWVCSLHLSA
jgi:hypothetical protein